MKNIDQDIFNYNKIFFLKKHNGSGGKDVFPINSLEEMNKIINTNYSNLYCRKRFQIHYYMMGTKLVCEYMF